MILHPETNLLGTFVESRNWLYFFLNYLLLTVEQLVKIA